MDCICAKTSTETHYPKPKVLCTVFNAFCRFSIHSKRRNREILKNERQLCPDAVPTIDSIENMPTHGDLFFFLYDCKLNLITVQPREQQNISNVVSKCYLLYSTGVAHHLNPYV